MLDCSKWKGLTEYEASPKRINAGSRPGGQGSAPTETPAGADQKPPAGLWRTIGPAAPPDQSPPKSSSAAGGVSAAGGFGFFSKGGEPRPGEKTAISTAFKKYVNIHAPVHSFFTLSFL